MNYEIICVIGPTASGKTSFSCKLALELGGEILSGDSRQVYRSMDIGTGKDLDDYTINGVQIPYHLIDIRDAGDKYNIFEYQHDFHAAYSEINDRGKLPILCGGSGLYVESVLKGYSLLDVPQNKALREKLSEYSLNELEQLLSGYKSLHNNTDLDTKQRTIRSIEIEEFKKKNILEVNEFPPLKSLNIGVDISRESRREKISIRLKERLENGMVEEIEEILKSGVPAADLIYYGLEYKHVTSYVIGDIRYEEMYDKLEIAIHQFAKRQMTWFRGMERRGLKIHWVKTELGVDEKVELVKSLMETKG